MNLFFLHRDAQTAAELQADVHVIKMLLEALQMLCCALHHCATPTIWPFPLYKVTHKSHPSTLWTRYCSAHFKWVLNHGTSLCEEYQKRYTKEHACHKYYRLINQMMEVQDITFFAMDMNKFDPNKIAHIGIPDCCSFIPLAISDDIFDETVVKDSQGRILGIESYKQYYMGKRFTMKRKMMWSKQETPPAKLQNISSYNKV